MFKKIVAKFVLPALVGASLSGAALAQQTGELWEMTSQMSIPGMPAGMVPARTNQVCQSKEFDRPPEQPDKSRCTISNLRQSPTRVTYDLRCDGKPPTTGSADYTFEANRTRMKGTMRMNSRDGEMVIQLAGRKLGTCDAVEQKRAQDKKAADTVAQFEGQLKQADDQQINQCRQDLAKMQPGFGIVGLCAHRDDKDCRSMVPTVRPAVKAACTDTLSQYCKRYETRDGLSQIGSNKQRLEQTARMCGQPLATVRARLCPAAVRDDALQFVALQCPAQAKEIAARECGGRSFTVMRGSKYGQFCGAYRGTLADAGGDDDTASPAAPARPAAAKAASPAPADATQKAISEGLGKLKGLFSK